MTVLVAFEPEQEFGGGVWARTVPAVCDPWLISESAIQDYWIVRGRRTRLLANTTGLGETGRPEDLASLEAVQLWLREWIWEHVLEPLILSTPCTTRLLFDTTTLGVLPLREALWSCWRAQRLDDAQILAWQPQQLYGARFTEAIFTYLEQPDPGYHTIQILISVPLQVARTSAELRACMRLIHRLATLARVKQVALDHDLVRERLFQALDHDRPGTLTLLVAHQCAKGELELGNDRVSVAEFAARLDTRPRGDWGLFVCHSEAPSNLAESLQDHGSPLLWTAGEYAYLRETLALLVGWLAVTNNPFGACFSASLTRARLVLERGAHVLL
jgi:hypothetical protein